MDIKSILAAKKADIPPEIEALKKYIKDHYGGQEVKVSISKNVYIIHVDSSSFASSLRAHTPQLEQLTGGQKVIFRID